MTKFKPAVEMARRRLENETAEQKEARRERCKGIVRYRWANTTPEQRKEVMVKIRQAKNKKI